jgi:hypothetical protein
MDIITSVLNWGPIRAWIKRSSRKPGADEALDAQITDIHFIDTVVSNYYEYGTWDEEVPEGHGYYIADQGIVRIYYRIWEFGNPITKRVSMRATDETDAKAIFDAFIRNKSLALIDDEFTNLDLVKASFDNDDSGDEVGQGLVFESDDVTGYWIPFPWDWDEGRFYPFRGAHRDTSPAWNDRFCTRAEAQDYFLENWGTPLKGNPRHIAADVISMMHDGHSRESALDSAFIDYDEFDDKLYQEVLKELEPLEREYKLGLEP